MRDRLIRTRSFAEGAFDPDAGYLGLIGETPRDADALVTYASHAATQFLAVRLPELDEEEDGATFNPERHAALIQDCVR